MTHFSETLSVLKWVKNGLMAIYFFVVGLEIKYEILRGELSNPRRLALPVLAALGGMIGPALVYLAFNAGTGGMRQGWPVPVATDIAFALAALAMAGPRLSPSLRIFLMTLAIADIARQKELRMNLHAVNAGENHLLRRDHRARRKIRGERFGRKITNFAFARRERGAHRRVRVGSQNRFSRRIWS